VTGDGSAVAGCISKKEKKAPYGKRKTREKAEN
jgi:hypothetical protein